jgi:aspartate-semialdehyde dehydrogenase
VSREAGHLQVALVGATGAVGREMLETLAQRRFPVASLRAFASSRSAGEAIDFGDATVVVEDLNALEDYSGFDLVLFSAGAQTSLDHAPQFAKTGAYVVDNSSAWRSHKNVPLVVPEINADALDGADLKMVAVPNCSTIALVQTLAPLHRAARVKRVVVSTYQSVSGAGRKGMDEMEQQVRHLLNGIAPEQEVFSHRIAFNCLPLIGDPDDDGFTGEEKKLMSETQRILNDDQVQVVATAVRVPVFIGHALSVAIETDDVLEVDDAAQALADHPGVLVTDRNDAMAVPTQADIAGEDFTLVGRLRADPTRAEGLLYWVVSDNLRKGAALNAVQIAEALLDRGLLPRAEKGE